MTSYTTKANYPYPAATDAITEYPTTAATFAGYLDNLPNRNRIINGAFDIWQRGTSFSNPATGTYTADRWVFTHNGTGGTRAIYRGTNAPGVLIDGMQARHYFQLQITNAGSPAATSQTIGQRVEDVRTYAGETVTISGWITNLGGGVGYNSATLKAIQNFGTSGGPSSAVTTTIGTITVTGSWARFSATVTLPSISGKTIGTDENSYLEIQFDVGGGTGNLYLYGIQLEQNSTRTAFEREPIQQTLAKCQRYYVLIAQGVNAMISDWHYYSATEAYSTLRFPVEMRSAPTADFTSGSNYFTINRNSGSNAFSTILDFTYANTRSVRIGSTGTYGISGTAGQTGHCLTSNASAKVAVSAEL